MRHYWSAVHGIREVKEDLTIEFAQMLLLYWPLPTSPIPHTFAISFNQRPITTINLRCGDIGPKDFRPRTSPCLGPLTMLRSPRKIPDGPEIFSFSYLFRTNPQTRATLPHQIQRLMRANNESNVFQGSWTFDTVGKGGENTPGTDLPVVAGPSWLITRVSFVIHSERSQGSGLGEVTSNYKARVLGIVVLSNI